MSLRFSGRMVIPSSLGIVPCGIDVTQNRSISVPISIKECDVARPYGKRREAFLYIPQNSDRIFAFTDTDPSVDFTDLTEINFDVWDSVTTGSTNRITKALTGTGITIPSDNIINVDVTNTDSSIAPGRYYFEIWATTTSSDQYLLKFGSFTIEDTREYD